MLYEYQLSTDRENLHNITPQINDALRKSGIQNGFAIVYTPHTTAAITVNENADPDVVHDLLLGLRKAYPEQPGFTHSEGNSTAHLKSSTVGCDQTLIINDGAYLLGIWQDVYFCEFDGPRNRRFFIKIIGE